MKKVLLLFIFLLSITACTEADQEEMSIPSLTTTAITEIIPISATSGGSIIDDGGRSVTAKGICWSTSPNPTIDNNITNDGTGLDSFTSLLTGLTANTTYYVRAYATNSEGTAYGNEEQFTTEPISASGVFTGETIAVEGGMFLMGSNDDDNDGVPNDIDPDPSDCAIPNPSACDDDNDGIPNDADADPSDCAIPNPSGCENEVEVSNEQPMHSVTVAGFSMSKYEITNQQYATYMNAIYANADGSVGNVTYLDMDADTIQISYIDGQFVAAEGKENHPVIKVSWYGAKAYAVYYGGRLPTEAEWEFAARGGNNTNSYVYSGSNVIDNVAWYNANSDATAHVVGGKSANELGLHDMSGNVWEWCGDLYAVDYYNSSPAVNPQGPASGYNRVARGGGWSGVLTTCRVAARGGSDPVFGQPNLGFRLVFPL